MIEVNPMKKGEERETYELIVRVFHAHVAPVYTKEGVAEFLGMLSPDGLNEMRGGEHSCVILAREHHTIIGVVSVIRDSHIALLFVDREYQMKGIGKKLIDEEIKICLNRNPDLSAVTVSSSPNSKTFYETVGFEAQGDEVDEDGMRFTPMRKSIAH
ncbi:MAG: GNAT family N-acetyltransferase [Deltaproteobacteria bacterium]|nr:GNAT family N-acetyltransferase [Candidatus Zymogenaceae bacterium]